MNEINEMYGEFKTDPDQNGVVAIYFNTLQPAVQSRGFMMAALSYRENRILRHVSEGYVTLEEAIKSLPENKDKFSIDQLNRHISSDWMRGFGTEYPEHGVVAYSGNSEMDRPVTKVNFSDGTHLFFLHPQANLMMKRT